MFPVTEEHYQFFESGLLKELNRQITIPEGHFMLNLTAESISVEATWIPNNPDFSRKKAAKRSVLLKISQDDLTNNQGDIPW